MNAPLSAQLKVLVIDDERPALDELTFLLGRDPRIGEVMGSDSATEALRVLQAEEVDAVFLDIQMPGLTGLDLAQVLSRFKSPPPVVFVTAHEEHAVAAFELRAVDYVLKPVREALILGEGSAELKTYMSAGQVIVLAFVVPLYAKLVATRPRMRLINTVTAFFTACPPHLTGALQLYFKAYILLGRVVRFLQRAPEPVGSGYAREDDPDLREQMTMTTFLRDVEGGTEVELVHDGVPDAVRREDNETGSRMALAKLAAYVEGTA